MIESILNFSLKSMTCSGVFVAYYLLVLKHTKMHSFTRIYLLSATFLSLLLPFAKFEFFDVFPAVIPDFPLLDVSAVGANETHTSETIAHQFNWQLLLVILYYTVGIVMVLKLVAKFIWVHYLKMGGVKIKNDGFLLIKTDDPRAPFSFLNMVFWPKEMRQDNPEGISILMHELAHVRQHHTLDKVFMQLMLAASWLNPFNWLIKKEIWLQHEFFADRYAIKDGNSETFAKMLLYSVTNSSNGSIISPFFQSNISRRLTMLSKPAVNTYGFMRRFLSIPLLFAIIFLLSSNTQNSKIIGSQKRIVLVLDAAHGGEDVGGESIYGQLEKDLTLALCKKIETLSGQYNIGILTTRDVDANYTLEQRLNISNKAEDAIFISVHVRKNPASNLNDNSYELGVNPESSNYSKGIILASAIANKMKIQKVPVKVVNHRMANVLNGNKHPALIIECGNLDDAYNITLLSDENLREVLCRNILTGIVDYNNKTNHF